MVMRWIRQELQSFKLVSKGREAIYVSKFSPISCNFQAQELLVNVLDHRDPNMTFD